MKLKAFIALITAIITVSFSAIFVRWADAPPVIIAFYRLFFAAVILIPIIFQKNSREDIFDISLSTVFYAVLSGIFFGFHFYFWISSLKYTSVASSTVLVTVHPLFVVIGSRLFLKEKINLRILPGILTACAGNIIISWQDLLLSPEYFKGDILALLGALTIAVYMLIGRKTRNEITTSAYVFITYSTSSCVLFILCLFTTNNFIFYSKITWLLFIALAVIPTLIGHTIFNWALKNVSAPVVSVSFLGEPVGASFLAWIFLNEIPGKGQLLGSFLVISGLIWVYWKGDL